MEQLVAYLKENAGFERLLLKFREKYQQLGAFSGIVHLDDPLDAEREMLSRIFRQDYSKVATIKVSLPKFEKMISSMRFGEIDGKLLLESYFNEEILTNKDIRANNMESRNSYFEEIKEHFVTTPFHRFFDYIFTSKTNSYKKMIEKYQKDKTALRNDLIQIGNCLNNLPVYQEKIERLAVFVTRITKDPHFFDNNKYCNTIFMRGIEYLLADELVENDDELLEIAGLVKDEISNYTICSGLTGHSGLQYYYENKEPVNLTLYNINRIESLSTPYNMVFVVENPSVFMAIHDKLAELKVPLICTNGQVRSSTTLLLKKLSNKTKIYYSGDFDPEGLGIANKLQKRFDNRLSLMLYSKEYYLKSLSDNHLSDSRLSKLGKVSIADEIVQTMNECKLAGYQEKIIDDLIDFVTKKLS